MIVATSVTIDGVAIDLAEVFADVTIRHGRTGFFDEAQASTCQLTLLDVERAFTRPFRLGSSLVVNVREDGGPEKPRFVGRFTDAGLAINDLTAIAVGRLATLSGYTIATADYPEEAWSARVTRAFTDAGLAAYLVLQPPAAPAIDPVLVARPADPTTLADYLSALADMIGAAVADTPDGKVLVQAIASRALHPAFVLDPELVEYAPSWSQVLPNANVVTLTYGDPAADPVASYTASDAASVALYGPIPRQVSTTIKNAADAQAVALTILARQSYAHWSIPEAPLLAGVTIAIGAPCSLTDMPDASPFDPWTPICEGWQDSITAGNGELEWRQELTLSDPLLSGLVLPWSDVPATAAYHWNTINQTVAWRDALTLDSLAP